MERLGFVKGVQGLLLSCHGGRGVARCRAEARGARRGMRARRQRGGLSRRKETSGVGWAGAVASRPKCTVAL
jgi:hypothetical protein